MVDNIKKLTQNDLAVWRSIRLESLKLHPEAFSSSYEQESEMSDEAFEQRLQKNDIFGAFVEAKLVGIAGFFIFQGVKIQHKGCLFGVYIKDEFRGRGIANNLINAVIGNARGKVSQIQCSVRTDNLAALQLYEKIGFKIYGTEKDALKVGNYSYDEYLMVLALS